MQGDGSELYSKGLVSKSFNWILKPNKKEFEVNAKFRYRQKDQSVKARICENNLVMIDFNEPQRAITLGQYVVLYDGDICLGGGTIDEVIK